MTALHIAITILFVITMVVALTMIYVSIKASIDDDEYWGDR